MARALPSCLFAGAGSLTLILWLGFLTPLGAGAEPIAVEMPLAIESLLLDGAAAGSRLVVVGERGHILFSTDGGASWTQAKVPTRALLTAVHMHDEDTGWAVGHDAVILRTGDGGATWKMVHQAPEEERPLLDVWFRDEHTGFAVGAYGYFLATADGGDTWTSRAVSEDDFHLNALVPAGSQRPGMQRPEMQPPEMQPPEMQPSGMQRLYIAAEAGVAYRSDDGGASWRELPSPYAGSWFGAARTRLGRGATDGTQGAPEGAPAPAGFRSEDAGETWTQVPTSTNATLTAAVRQPSGQILITGLEGSVLTSRDGGRSVSTRRLPSARGSRPRCRSRTAACC